MLRHIQVTCWLLPLVALVLTGCGESEVELAPAGGTVKFTDGTVPQGETAIVNFSPSGKDKKALKKGASADIQPDGSFQLMTVEPGDGVIPGKYKVTIIVHKTYLGQELLVPPKYLQAQTTPFEETIELGKPNQFEFTLDKP